MKRLGIGLILLLACAQFAHAMERFSNRCALASTVVTTSPAPLVAVSCTITVFDSGTANLSSIFSDDGVTPLANPFTAQGGATGWFFFYAANAVYDVRMTGGTPTIGTVTIGAVTLGGGAGGGTVTAVTATAPITSTGGTTPVIACPACARTDANNNFGAFYMDLAQIAAPASPGAGTRRIFVNSADGTFSLKRSDGTVVSLETIASAAPVGATYITQTADATLTNEQALSALATGILKNTTGTGVLSIATGPDLPSHTHTEAQITDLGTAVVVPQGRTISTTSPLAGGGALTGNLTLTCATCEVTTNKNAANGYAGLDGSTLLLAARFPILTGDVTTAGGALATTLAASGVTPGTYTKLTVDAKGRATVGASLLAGDLPAHSHSTADLTSGTLGETRGGTGESTYTSGQLLIGNAGGGLTKATLTPGTNISITNGDGSIQIDALGSGITSLNGQTGNVQTFATGTTGTDFNIASAGTIHTFHFPSSSSANRGLLTAADWSTFNAKVATTRALICAAGLTGCGDLSADRTLAFDFNSLTTKTTPVDADLVPIYDPAAGAHRKVTRASFLAGVTGAVIYQGTWNASTNTPTLADGTGTKGFYFVVAVAGSQDLGSGSITFTVEDWVIHNGSIWQKVDAVNLVSSVFGRTGTVVAVANDYAANEVENTPAGGIAATNVQAAIDELDTEKAAASHTHAAADVTSGTLGTARLGSGTADSTVFLRGDSTWAVVPGSSGTSTSHGAIYVSTSASTAITANVYAKLAGTTTAISLSDFTMTADNRLRYDGAATILFKFVATVALRGTGNNLTASIRIAKNSTTDATTETAINLATNARAETLVSTGIISLATNDFLEIWATAVSNNTLTADKLILNVFATGGASGANEFTDSVFRVIDDGDPTKKIAFQASGITTATTRTYTTPDYNGTLATIAGTETFTGKTLDAEGSGNILTIPVLVTYKAAVCQNTTPSLGFSTPTSNPAVAACVTGTNTQYGVAQFADGASTLSVQDHFMLPDDWTGAIDVDGYWRTSATTGSVVWQVQTICVANAETGDPAFNTASTVTDAALGTTLQFNKFSMTGITVTGCAAGEELFFRVLRDPTHGSDDLAATADLISLRFKLRRAM